MTDSIRKRFLLILLSVAVVFAFMPILPAVHPAYAGGGGDTIYIGGTMLTTSASPIYATTDKDGKVTLIDDSDPDPESHYNIKLYSFDNPSRAVIELRNATIKGPDASPIAGAGILLTSDSGILSIIAEGTNKVEAGNPLGSRCSAIGCKSATELHIGGTGSLTAIAGPASGGSTNYAESCGIYCPGSIMIHDSVKLKAVGADSATTAIQHAFSLGIFSNRAITVSDSANVTAAGAAASSPSFSESYGVAATGNSSENGLTVSGSAKLTASGGKSTGTAHYDNYGIYIQGPVTTSGKAQVKASGANANGYGIAATGVVTPGGNNFIAQGSKRSLTGIKTVVYEPYSTPTVTLGTGNKAYTAASYDGSGTHYAYNSNTKLSGKYFRSLAAPVKGVKYAVGNYKYMITNTSVTGSGTVAVAGSVSNKLTSLVIGQAIYIQGVRYNITSITKKAFAVNKKARSVTIKSKTLKSIGKGAFNKCKRGCAFKLPKSKFSKYKKILRKSGVPRYSKFMKI